MTSATFLAGVHVVYAGMLFLVTNYMKDRKRPSWVPAVSFVHNLNMSVLSLVMLIGLIAGAVWDKRFDSLDAFGCRPAADYVGAVPFWMYVFYLSKMLEFIDTFLLVLSKKDLIWLHKVHHLTTMSLVWHAMVNNYALDLISAGTNCIVHTIMYLYFAKPIRFLRPFITSSQIVQFLLVLALHINAFYQRFMSHSPCRGSFYAELHGTGMYGLYLGMFVNFFVQQYLKNRKERRGRATESELAAGELPEAVFKTSATRALLILAKGVALATLGLLATSNLPWFLVPAGVLLTALGMSCFYVAGAACSRSHFFPGPIANTIVGTLALLPFLRPLPSLRRELSPEEARRSWVVRLLAPAVGVSAGHLMVFAFASLFFPLVIAHYGFVGCVKYWLLPFLVMHYNMNTLRAKGASRSHALLFPELLRTHVRSPQSQGAAGKTSLPAPVEASATPKKSSSSTASGSNTRQRKGAAQTSTFVPVNTPADDVSSVSDVVEDNLRVAEDVLRDVPIYNLPAAARALASSVIIKRDVRPLQPTLTQSLTRNLLLWRTRDLVLHITAITFCAAVAAGQPQLGQYCLAALVPLFFFRSGGSRAASSLHGASETKPVVAAPGKMEVLINERIYDVTEFAKRHPGGSIIRFSAGTDGTAAFTEFHHRCPKAAAVLKSLPYRPDDGEFGKATGGRGRQSLLKDFAVLREQLVKEGLFEPSLTYTVLRLLELVVMHAVGIYMVRTSTTAWELRSVLGLVLLGLGQARCGWYMHEGGHYSLTGNIRADRMLQLFSMGLGCGMSAAWWRNQHNKHHAAAQKIKHDVDLETLPLIAFNRVIMRRASPAMRKWLRFQAYLFTPVITTLVALAWQSFLHPRHAYRIGRYDELAVFAVRYTAWAALFATRFGAATAVGMYFFYLMIGASYIFMTFGVSHSHRPVLMPDEHTDWVGYSANHTINCTPSLLCNWWMGYLNFQIEHHLFPSMPQFRHPTIAPRIKAFFESHGLEYDVRDFFVALWDTLRNLNDVASHDYEAEKVIEGAATAGAPVAGAVDKPKVRVHLFSKSVDVTSWLRRHPGGAKVLYMYEGRDATEVFEAYHTPEARMVLDKLLKASPAVDCPLERDPVAMDFRLLIAELTRRGFYKAQPLAELIKMGVNFGIYGAAVYCLKVSGQNYLGCFLLALGMQQSGWAGHDFSHHSVFRSPFWNDAVGRMFGWLQGYEIQWWKARHNTHHVSTNEEANDPDIRTSPLFTYIFKNVHRAKDLSAVQRLQHLYFLPALGLLHMYWRFESAQYIASRLPRMWPHALLLASHYVGLVWLLQAAPALAILLYLVSKGVMTGAIVFATHYGEERLPANHGLSLAAQTVLTSRNIAGGWLLNHFTGYISYQVEHHLFPTMPRCNYPAVQPFVRDFCAKHNLPYNEDSIWVCMRRNMEQLDVNNARAS